MSKSPAQHAAAAAPLIVPPLHAAIWAGDVNRVRAILHDARTSNTNSAAADRNTVVQRGSTVTTAATSPLKQLLETKDAHGNSALHLAVRLVHPSQRAIVQLLLKHDASVTSRNTNGWSSVHDATLCDDEFLLAQVFLRGEKQLWRLLQSRQEPFFRALEHLPDFTAEIFVEAHSWVPIVSKILPSDTLRLSKRGSSLRIDSELKGLDGLKWKRGRMSHLFMGRATDRPGHAIVVDHERELFYDVAAALERPTATSIDVGLHVLLTTPLSSSTIDSSNMTFHKRKDVKKSQHATKKGRKCPWTGSKYKMEGFKVAAQFRPVVCPKRQLLQSTDAADAPLHELQQFVNHLSVHGNSRDTKTKSNSMRHTNIGSDSEDDNTDAPQQEQQQRKHSSAAAASATHQTPPLSIATALPLHSTLLRLPKGKKVEMHLDVQVGDTIAWSFRSNSRSFCFTATYFHDDARLPVCQTDGVKNVVIAGAFGIEFPGSFVLMWVNTQTGFVLDASGGIKVQYDVQHTRPALQQLPVLLQSHAAATVASDAVNEKQNENQNGIQDAMSISTASATDDCATSDDAHQCQPFLRLDHMPNALTATTSFYDYFSGPEPPTPASIDANETKTAPSKVSSLFKRSNQHKKRSADTDDESDDTGDRTIATTSGDCRNTFRSLTVVPESRRMAKAFDAKVLMADAFPIALTDFLPVIQFLSHTGEHVQNLEDFFQLKLPPGFPVKFELPMMFTVRVAYTFERLTLANDLDPTLFEIPRSYRQVYSLKEVRA